MKHARGEGKHRERRRLSDWGFNTFPQIDRRMSDKKVKTNISERDSETMTPILSSHSLRQRRTSFGGAAIDKVKCFGRVNRDV